MNRKPLILFGSPTRTRTRDRVVNSHLLYRLSYWGMSLQGRNIRDCPGGVKGFFISGVF